jgi:hypothetical protein
MMDGYSVQDAASVLGVPEGRVWELLARGVLNGTPEGDSMRVFLKADTPAVSRPAPRQELPRSNGNGGSHGAEASAFRELLTEFRNLTERYGQALLALGEARGEVAGLRSRVELLEARIDLRLPSRMEMEPISWEAPAPRAPAPEAPAPEPPTPAQVEAVLPAPAPFERAPRPRKARSTRAAVAGFAEALARAQDPNLADVGEAPASEELASEPPMAEMAVEPLPTGEDEVVAAEAAEGVPEAEATYRATLVEPDWFADGDFSWLDAADLEARGQGEMIAVEVGTAPLEAQVEMEAEVAPEPIPDPIDEAELATQPEIVAEAAPEPVAVFVEAPTPAPEALFVEAPTPEPEPEAPVTAPQMDPVEMSGAGEEAVLWLGGPRDAADEMEVATTGSYPGPSLAPRIRDALEQVAWPPADRGASTTQTVPPPLAMTEEELAQLARDEGWDDAEVAAIRAMISRPTTGTVELPGSAELEEAISALQAVPIAPRSEAAPGSQWAKTATRGEETSARDDWAFEVEPQPSTTHLVEPSLAPRRVAPDPDWVRRRRGPAASAYRRIRRIFTG